MACMYYHKTFDRVSHSWIIKSLELVGINNNIIPFTNKTMSYWGQNMSLCTEEKLIETEEIAHCDVFQGHSFSPLLFCITLIPLTKQLKWVQFMNSMWRRQKSHSPDTDDLRLMDKTVEELQKQLLTKVSAIIFTWNWGLTNVKILYSREEYQFTRDT
jgi:hypothetical protein